MYINKALLYGNVTRDPELRSLPSGIKVVSFSIATNRTWKDKNNVKQESVTYHNIVAYGKPAETIAQYIKKGSGIFVEGRIETRSWDDKDGTKKYRTEVIIDNFQFGLSSGSSPSTMRQGRSEDEKADVKEPLGQMDTIEYPTEEINPEDIPF